MGRMFIPVIDGEGQEAEVELTVRRDSVECVSDGLSRAVFDRETLRTWLGDPAGRIESDDVTFSRLTRGGIGVAVAVTVPCRAVPEHVFLAMRERI